MAGGVVKRKRDIFLWLGLGFLIALLLFAVFGPAVRTAMLKGTSPDLKNAVIDQAGKPHLSPNAQFWLGTDEQGRDIVSRLAGGARVSLMVGLIVQLISLLVGITVGMLAVFAPKWVANPLMRFTDGMFAFPDILLAILVIAIMGQGVLPVVVALSVSAWPSIARLVRSQVVTLKDREFVVAAKATGAPTVYLVMKHILPQLSGLLMAVSMLEIAGTILSESTLSFLGIGVQAPNPSWGSMINNARTEMTSYAEWLIAPCLILSMTVFALNFVGDGLRNRFDPKGQ